MQEEEGRPRVDRGARALGERVPGDIALDAEGCVAPAQGGMSVSPSLRALPAHRVPHRLRAHAPRATGRDTDRVWSHGEGPFSPGPVDPGLRLRPDTGNTRHGVVEPAARMTLAEYERSLEGTRDDWQIDEG